MFRLWLFKGTHLSHHYVVVSSEREPSQVFRLLETVYREFDIEARKLGVFKVETVGDCYVAVTGLPDPRDDHAIVIAKYAVRCLLKFNVLTKRLEANLGPGTASLGMRFGLHSGPVTAGVLRGEKSRFQLFGDTINVVSNFFKDNRWTGLNMSLHGILTSLYCRHLGWKARERRT